MKQISNIFILSLSLFCWASHAPAQLLTLEQCRQKALEHNRSLSSAKIKMKQTQFDMRSYRANFFPQINLVATDFYSTANGDFTVAGGHLPIYNYVETTGQFVPNVTSNTDGSYTLNQYADFPSQTMKWKLQNVFAGGVFFMQPIYAGGKICAAYQMSKIGVNMAYENIRLTEDEVMVKTDEAYFLAVKAKEQGDVARSYKTLLEELKKNVEGTFRHGMSTRNDLMKVKVRLNDVELSIQKADNGYRMAIMNLCHIIGMPLDSGISVETEMSLPGDPSGVAETFAIVPRPEYAILQNKTELAYQQVKLAKSGYRPTVTAGASYLYAHGGELAGKRMIDNGALTMGIAVKMPLDFFGNADNKVHSAHAAYQIAKLEQQDLNELMQLELAQCSNNLDEAITELRLCEMAQEQSAENMCLSKQQYEVGLEALSDYLEAQAQWQQCCANLVNARCQLQLAHVKLLKASGNLR